MGRLDIASDVRPLVIYATGDAAIAGTCWGDLRCVDVDIPARWARDGDEDTMRLRSERNGDQAAIHQELVAAGLDDEARRDLCGSASTVL